MEWWCERLVGYGRLVGEAASEQLAELYRALRLYVNCFQPRVLLVAKQVQGRTIQRTYDAATTPLERLLRSGVLPVSRQQELRAMVKALDPLRLFEQIERLQQALFRCEVSDLTPGQKAQAPALVPFELDGITTEQILCQASAAKEDAMAPQEPWESLRILNWRHTCKDPFVKQWEQILALVQTDPTLSSGDIFRHLQSQFPGRYQPGHLRTLQRGLRKIRAFVLAMREEPREQEVIQAEESISAALPQATLSPGEALPRASGCVPLRSADPSATRRVLALSEKTTCWVAPAPTSSERKAATPASYASSRRRSHPLTIEGAIQSYLQAHRKARHRPKTLEWHQMVLHQLQDYLQLERHLIHVSQITATDLDAWIASLHQTPTPAGRPRSTSTIETYARSARAFCRWLVHQGVLPCSPMSKEASPRASVPFPQVVSPETFERFVQASCPKASQALTTKRDRALLWVLFDTGITLAEVCALCLCDVDWTTGMLLVRGKGGKIRRMILGSSCLSHLRSYLDQAYPGKKNALTSRKRGDDPLFVSERGYGLTKSSLTSLLNRLHKRAGVSEAAISPQHLRHSFALRYLRAGGEPQGLQALMGYEGMAPVRQYLRWHTQWLHDQMQKRTEEV